MVIFLSIYDLCIWTYRLFFRRIPYLEERLKAMDYELIRKYPFFNPCYDHVNQKDNEHLIKGKEIIELIDRTSVCLVQSRDETSATTGDEIYILSDGRKVHHQSRPYIVPRVYYKDKRLKIFDFFNDEYLEADGYFILRIIGTNGR